jgi:outer membrane protein TolC
MHLASGIGLAGFLTVLCVAQEPATPGGRVVHLSLKQAVNVAFSSEGNAAVQIAGQEARIAKAKSNEALSALLPTLDGNTYLTNYTRSFAAQGLTEFSLPFGVKIPNRIGPVTSVDVRAGLSVNVVNLGAIRRYQATRAGRRASEMESDNTKESVAARTARQYMTALRAAAQVEAAEANVKLAEALVQQASRVREAGNGTGIDVTRAQVQLADTQQRLQAARSQQTQANLSLLRTMGLSLDSDLDLTERLTYVPVDPISPAEAKSQAQKVRSDLLAQKEREEAARLALSASRMEHLPSLAAYGDYGTTGNSTQGLLPTRTYGLSMRVPVYEGGRRAAQTAENSAQYREQTIRTRDLNDEIDLEIRLALERLASAEQQLKTATAGLTLAETELEQANRRYVEGVTGSIEVTDAQTRLIRARDNRIDALFSHNLARIDLNYSMGSLVEMIEK